MKKNLFLLRKVITGAICIAFIISFVCLYFKKENVKAADENAVITVWQIDSFEGGKGSRADYLQKIGKEFSKKQRCYVNVISLSPDAARMNLSKGNVPDAISYGSGMYGLETYVKDYTVWCRGGYCLLTLEANSDFSDANAENTVINRGKDNFAGAAALFLGISNGKYENATTAYVRLLDGNYKYLLGTQRDVYRLKTRNVSFSVKPLTQFNDLYQGISVTSKCENAAYAGLFIQSLLSEKSEISKVGMFCDGEKLYDDELSVCENISFEHKMNYPISEAVKTSVERAVELGDINMLKELLN